MNFNDFKISLSQPAPPKDLDVLLKALWYDAKGDWNTAHNLGQDIDTPDGSWIHAYLHRKEGDLGNASYWYNRAKRKIPSVSLSEEWEEITKELINKLKAG